MALPRAWPRMLPEAPLCSTHSRGRSADLTEGNAPALRARPLTAVSPAGALRAPGPTPFH